MTHLKIGDRAPVINSVDENGDVITLEQFTGKTVVLYFYPKDMTPGCTQESCDKIHYFIHHMKKLLISFT